MPISKSMKNTESKQLFLQFAMHDPSCCLAPGLFKSLKKGERTKEKLDVTYKISKKESCRFTCFEPLGAEDLRILQGLASYCAKPYKQRTTLLTPETNSEIGKLLREKAKLSGDAISETMCVSHLYPYVFLTQLNLTPSKRNYELLMSSLHRLSNVTMEYKNEEACKGRVGWATTHLMSFAVVDEHIYVSMNFRLTQAMLQIEKASAYTLIVMDEVREIKSACTRLIHQRLCGWLRQGQKGKISIEKIMSYAFGDEECSNATYRKRQQRTREFIQELGELGWGFTEVEKGMFEVQRPEASPTTI